MTRTVLILGLCTMVLSLSHGPVPAADLPRRIRFAYVSRSNIVAPKHLAQSRGFFKAEGLEMELIQMNPRLSATAIVNGDVSYGDAFTSTFRGARKDSRSSSSWCIRRKGHTF